MVKQKKNYIAEKKKNHFIKAVIWAGVIIAIMGAGILLLDTRLSYFTVVAAVLVLPLALHITRFFAFAKYKDPSPKQAALLEQIKGHYGLYHSAIIPDTTCTLYFEHIIVTTKSIYFISKNKEIIQKAKPILALRLGNKGIQNSKLHFIYAENGKTIKNATIRIEKDACQVGEALENTIKIIDGMLM